MQASPFSLAGGSGWLHLHGGLFSGARCLRQRRVRYGGRRRRYQLLPILPSAAAILYLGILWLRRRAHGDTSGISAMSSNGMSAISRNCVVVNRRGRLAGRAGVERWRALIRRGRARGAIIVVEWGGEWCACCTTAGWVFCGGQCGVFQGT